MEFIEKFVRSLLWSVAQLFLFVADWIMKIIDTLGLVNIADNTDIFVLVTVITIFCFGTVGIRGFTMYWKFRETNELPMTIDKFAQRLLKMGISMIMLVMISSFVISFGTWSVSSARSWLNMPVTITPSEIVLTNTATTVLKSDISEIKGSAETIKIDDFDINKKTHDGYDYYSGWTELALGILISGAMLIAMFQLFWYYFARWLAIMINFIFSSIAITSLLGESDRVYNDWVSSIGIDVVLNAVTLFLLTIIPWIFGSTGLFKDSNQFIRAILLIVALLSIKVLTDVVARLLGGKDTNGGNARGVMGTVMGGAFLLGNAVKGGLSLAKQGLDVAGGVSSFGAQKVGQALGGESINNLEKNGLIQNARGGNAYANPMGAGFGGANPTQEKMNSVLNNDLGAKIGTNPFNSTRQTGRGTTTTHRGAMKRQQERLDKKTTEILGGNTQNLNKPLETPRMTREGTFARNFSDSVANMSGTKGAIARTTVKAGKHAYTYSANRYSKTALRNVSRNFEPSRNYMDSKPTFNSGIQNDFRNINAEEEVEN